MVWGLFKNDISPLVNYESYLLVSNQESSEDYLLSLNPLNLLFRLLTCVVRCVVCRDGVAVEMSADHKPEDDIELKRIKNAGGKVTPDGRVNGGLNLSRAIG